MHKTHTNKLQKQTKDIQRHKQKDQITPHHEPNPTHNPRPKHTCHSAHDTEHNSHTPNTRHRNKKNKKQEHSTATQLP